MADYGSLYEAVEVSCDGEDNDCDGFADSTPPVQLATGVVSDYEFFAEPNGFAAVYATQAQGLVVSRYDQRLALLGTTVVAPGLNPQHLAAGSRGGDVYVVWSQDGGVQAAHVAPGSMTPEYYPSLPTTTGLSDNLRVGVRNDALVAGFLAQADTRAELVTWPLDGGLLGRATLNALPDGGLWTQDDLYEMNVSRGGLSRCGAASTSSWTAGRPTACTAPSRRCPPYRVVLTDYPGGGGTLIEDGARLTNTYRYSFFSIIPFIDSYSGVYFVKNLLMNNDEVSVRRIDKEADAIGSVHATIINGVTYVTYMDRQTNRLVIAREARSGSNTSFVVRDASNNGGYGVPRIAGTTTYLAQAWEQNGVLTAQRTCAP